MDQGTAVVTRVSAHVVEALAAAREDLNSLNVFPVADSDTGTNLFLTFDCAHTELSGYLAEHPDADPFAAVAAYERSLLLAARGNSGVIMAQLFGTCVRRVMATQLGSAAEDLPAALAEAMREATTAAYAAVGVPVEGTVLTVARAASEAATTASVRPDASVSKVLRAASAAAREALSHTPEMLPVLEREGVVDAGGSGLCVVLDAVEAALLGSRYVPVSEAPARNRPVRAGSAEHVAAISEHAHPGGDLSEQGPAYEVMYLLEADDVMIPGLRAELLGLGDSLVVVGGDRVWNVHVHVDDAGAAIEAGLRAGRPYRIRITHFAEHHRAPSGRTGRRIVAVAFGDGLAEVFREAGATVVMAYPDIRPTDAELTQAILDTGAAEVFLMPNDRRIATAEAAAARAGEHGVRVAIVPTQSQVQGLAALAVHEPHRGFEQDLVEMAATGRHARSGAVTVAAVTAMTMAGPCEPGDVLGVIEGDFMLVGDDPYTVATEVLDRLIGGGGELVTIVIGAGGAELAARCEQYVTQTYAHVDVLTYEGRQDRYPLFFGVE